MDIGETSVIHNKISTINKSTFFQQYFHLGGRILSIHGTFRIREVNILAKHLCTGAE